MMEVDWVGVDENFDFKSTYDFVAFSIMKRCVLGLRCESGHLTGQPITTMNEQNTGINGPRVYVCSNHIGDDNIRISVGDSFRGYHRHLVYPPRGSDWEVVLFDGSIADPEFDLENY